MKKSFIHVYCGEGKGKTSILNGSAIRAVGANLNVCYIRFLKNRNTSENEIMEKIGIPINNFYHFSTKFVWEMNPQEVEEFKLETLKGFEFLKEQLQNPKLKLILVDELLGAVENKFIPKDELIDALKNRLPDIEVMISGRYIFEGLSEIVDLISEVKPIKHYFDEHVVARKGIEF